MCPVCVYTHTHTERERERERERDTHTHRERVPVLPDIGGHGDCGDAHTSPGDLAGDFGDLPGDFCLGFRTLHSPKSTSLIVSMSVRYVYI